MSYCPNAEKHTPCPDGYIGWHDWAAKKSLTHTQEKCPGCGKFAIWKPRAKEQTPV